MSSVRPESGVERLDENGQRIHRQGRYFKYGEETKVMRVPVSMVEKCHNWLKEQMKEKKND